MYCPSCGTQTDAQHCPNCGTDVTAATSSAGATAGPGAQVLPGATPSAGMQPGAAGWRPAPVLIADPVEARNWSVGCHIAALAGIVIPFGNVLGPLVVWLVKRDGSPTVDRAGKEALNFQISMTIYLFVAGLLMFLLIGFVLLPIVALVDLVLTIVAAVKTSNGEDYRYPLTIRLLT